ncbi:MAG: chemotaxis protein CheW [Chitinivibrionales bacterium]|nr:chemotaxis protein CheW [Chitinivibrionales bacterium]MBD3355799.1 chemotaxis protein CheW [Chitinivibrionales bacterium]
MGREQTKTALNEMELVVFTVADVPCALRIEEVREIKRIGRITPVHNAPRYVRGVVNLRGHIVTVIDLRTKMDYPHRPVGTHARMVVVWRDEEQIGLLVDTIEDALVVYEEDIAGPPPNVNGAEGRLFRGVYKAAETLVAILNLEAILEKGQSDASAQH